MTYRLIIVDDEEHIREGLCDLVNWDSLGFQVIAKLEDGKQALEWLQKTDVDVILTDINMTFISGLELAKYVYEQYPATKVVLISGFKEFEFAKQAIAYNVVNYLLKPTKLSQIVSVFQELKLKLDKEKEDRERIAMVMKQNNELLPTIRKQLFHDLSTGRLIDQQEAENLLRLTGVHATTQNNRCALLRLSCLLAEAQQEDPNEHIPAEAIENLVKSEHDGVLYIPLNWSSGQLYIFALDLQADRDGGAFREAVLVHMRTAAARLASLLSVEAAGGIVRDFDHLNAMMQASQTHHPIQDNLLEHNPTEISIRDLPYLADLHKQFHTFVHAGNFSVLPDLYDQLLNAFIQESMPEHVAKNMLIELFSSICGKLNELGSPIGKITDKPFRYEAILRMNGYPHLLEWGCALLKEIADYMEARSSSEPSVVQKAKEYVHLQFDKDISLESAASYVYLSADYFGRIFKQHTGSSFTDYVTETRIHKAMQYLQDPQYKIYEIGDLVGYKNTKYFFKLFKKLTGYTPTEYRRKSAGTEL
ncbi:response regulator [Paenibacillus oryzisoli]|uniref:response regulator transcription factor n=1 Tax=Paenibacillus oryzisoli TaxID=1850517 RepID=UPI003D2C0D45